MSISTNNTTWDLKALFEGDNDPKMKEQRDLVEKKNYEFINKWKDRKDYLEDPAALAEALGEYEQLEKLYGCDGNEGYYFYLRMAQDQNDPEFKANMNKIEDFGRKIANDIQFFELRIAKIPEGAQKKFLEYEGLRDYRHFLEKLFAESKYLLSEAEEKILTLKAATSHSNWVKMVSGFLSKEEREVLSEDGKRGVKTFSELSALMQSQDKKVRDCAAEALNEILNKHSETAEAELNSILANKKVNDELRKISRPDFTRHNGDDIESEVVDALVVAVSERFDISEKYYELKAKLIGVEKLEYYERSVSYGKIDKKYSYGAAVDLVHDVLKKLDKQFSDIFIGFAENGQIDVYPKKSKLGGAFCMYNLITQPTYILLNYNEKLNDVLTLAHETGHGINNELVRKKQNALNFGTPTSTAEVASTFMEDFVLEEIVRNADEELKLAVMMMKLNDDISTIFRQIACYKFEQELHRQFREKGYLSKDDIGKLFQKHMAAHMGRFVEQSPGSENWWVHWPHIRNFFYNYSYASGLLISKSLQNFVRQDPKFISKVKEFLSVGLSDSPKNIFGNLGVDITKKDFWNKGLDEVEGLLQETIKLAEKLGKI